MRDAGGGVARDRPGHLAAVGRAGSSADDRHRVTAEQLQLRAEVFEEDANGEGYSPPDLIRVLDGVGEAYRHGRHPDRKAAQPIAKLLRALASELEA